MKTRVAGERERQTDRQTDRILRKPTVPVARDDLEEAHVTC